MDNQTVTIDPELCNLCGFLIAALNSSPELKAVLQIPESHQVPVTFMIGHPDIAYFESAGAKSREGRLPVIIDFTRTYALYRLIGN